MTAHEFVDVASTPRADNIVMRLAGIDVMSERSVIRLPHTTTDPPQPRAVTDFESVRSRLFGIAYRMLGSRSRAEDVVQDVWVRWQGADCARVRDPVAFLVTITTRVALNAATSACARREVTARRLRIEAPHDRYHEGPRPQGDPPCIRAGPCRITG